MNTTEPATIPASPAAIAQAQAQEKFNGLPAETQAIALAIASEIDDDSELLRVISGLTHLAQSRLHPKP